MVEELDEAITTTTCVALPTVTGTPKFGAGAGLGAGLGVGGLGTGFLTTRFGAAGACARVFGLAATVRFGTTGATTTAVAFAACFRTAPTPDRLVGWAVDVAEYGARDELLEGGGLDDDNVAVVACRVTGLGLVPALVVEVTTGRVELE